MDYLNGYYELYHHGILGQKWGVRRFQNPDGTLTAEGRLRYKVDPKTGKYVKLNYKERKQAKAKQAAEKAAELAKKNHSPRDKKINQLTDKQLDKYIDRMGKEKRALELRKDVNNLDPKPISRGEKFVNDMIDKVVIPAVQDAGRNYLARVLNQALGNNNNNKNKNNNNNNNNNGNNGQLSDKQKSRAKDLYSKGKSFAEIAKQFNVSEETVKKYFNG